MAQHPHSFGNPDEPAVTRPRGRSFQLDDERGRSVAWDSEAPATAHDWAVESKESRAPLYIAGAAAVVILGGLLLLAGVVNGEPELGVTVETESVPRQAALSEKLDAEALDRARAAVIGMAPTVSEAPNAPAQTEATSSDPTGAEPIGADPAIGPTTTGGMSVDAASIAPSPADIEPSPAPAADESGTTPAPNATTTPPEIMLERDNPYTTEIESSDGAAEGSEPARGTGTSDNPY